MQPETLIESNGQPDGLVELYQLLSRKEPGYVSAQELVQKGLTEQQAQMILEISTANNEAAQKIDFYTKDSNKSINDQNLQFTLQRNKSLQKSGEDTMLLVDRLKKSLIDNATGTLSAYNRVITIYTIAFLIGVALIITAIVFGALGETILAISFGAIGLIDIITYFVKLPANKIQESRSNLSQLQVVLLVWLKELINNDALCARILNTENPSIAAYKELSEISINNTSSLLKLIEDMAEPKL